MAENDSEPYLWKGVFVMVKTYSKKANGGDNVSKSFKVREFACKDGSDEILIDVGFVCSQLQMVRDVFGKPVVVNSGYRTSAYNKKVGGAAGSYHMKGRAFDISIAGVDLMEVAKLAEMNSVKGIIVYESQGFIHLDSREERYYAIKGGKERVGTFGSMYNPKYSRHLADLQWSLNQDGISKHMLGGVELAVDGIYGAKTSQALGGVMINMANPGQRNTCSWVQCRLGCTVDGLFGAATLKRVMWYKESNKLMNTSEIDKPTIVTLLKGLGVWM